MSPCIDCSKISLVFSNYIVSSSLEQVFIKLVQDAENPEGVEEERTVESDA
jgi:hypothetical protein